MARIAGIAFFKVNGSQFSLRANLIMSLGVTEGESVVGIDGFHGTKITPIAPFIEAQFTDDDIDIDLNVLQTLANATITVELINGRIGTLRNATQINALELDPVEATYTARFEGPTGEWSKGTGPIVPGA